MQPGSGNNQHAADFAAAGKFGQLLGMALHAAKAGIWEWNPAEGHLWWSDEIWQVMGIPRDSPPSLETCIQSIHPEDRELFRRAAVAAVEDDLPRIELQFRILRPDGDCRWIIDIGEVIRPPDPRAGSWTGIMVDITERVLSDKNRARAETNYRAIVEQLNDAVCRWRPDTTLTFANQQYCKLLGIDVAAVPDTRWINLVPETERETVLGHIRAMLDGRRETTYEHNVILKDGSVRWYLWTDIPLVDEHGACTEIQSIGRDITERKQAETRLTHSESLFRRIFEDAPIGMALINRAGRPVRVNQSLADMLGRSCEELVGLSLKDFTHPDEREADWHLFDDLFAGRIHGYVLERRLVRRGGAVIRARIKCVRIPDRDDVIFGMIEDITLQRETEEELRWRVDQRTEQIQLQAAAMDSTLDGMAVLEADAYVYMNPAHAAMYGYKPGELIGRNWRLLHPPEEVRMFETSAMSEVASTGSWRGEVTGRRKDGSLFDVEICLIRAPNGTLICCCKDISVAKQAERELRRRGEELERATRLKDEFLASMSHELRTPLAGILGFSEVLRTGIYGELPPKQLEAVKAIEDSGRHLLAMINDILDLSKIESGRLTLNPEIAAIGPLCEACVHMVRSAMSRKCISISAKVEPPDLAGRVDPRRFKQILINLLDNAAKFTAIGGTVQVRARMSDDGANLVLEVEDNGLGIEEKDLDRIFHPFEQVHSGLAREYGGAGLGLSLVLRLAELHGGSVAVKSAPGKGSCFTVTLPRNAEAGDGMSTEHHAGSGRPAADVARLHNRKILIIEDNKSTIRILGDLLTAKGARIDVVSESPKAMGKIQAFGPDAILMDIQMPVIDGFALATMIRKHGDPRLCTVPIIALTALAMPGDRERCFASGMNAYLPKPFRLDEVLQTLCDHLPKTSP